MNRSTEQRAQGQDAGRPGVPLIGRRILEEKLAGAPHRLYCLDSDGGLVPVSSDRLEINPRDPWDAELASARLWEAAGGAQLPLSRLPRRPGLPEPGTELFLKPILDGKTLQGGLVVRSSGDPSDLERRLSDPAFETDLLLLLELWQTNRERDDLARFRHCVAETLPYGTLAIDALGRVTYAGGKAAEILGLGEEEALGSDCTRVFRPVASGPHPILSALRGKVDPVELYVNRPDGSDLPVSLQVARGRTKGGRASSAIAFFQDLTEERALEEAERHRDRLAALGELSAGVAHEIRNPLTGIANCAQVLQENIEPDDPHQRFLKIILDEAARLNRIVEGLLSYARPNRPELREGSAVDCVKRACELMEGETKSRGIRVEIRVIGRIPRIYLDENQITQVLLNLLRNAVESMPTGGEASVEAIIIRRRSHRRRGTGRRSDDRARLQSSQGPQQRYVQIKITDTGHGIPKDLLGRVFNPFFTTRTRGTGLGLSLSQSIVREHGGLLTIRSVEKKGTTVLLDLPVERRQGERRKEPR